METRGAALNNMGLWGWFQSYTLQISRTKRAISGPPADSEVEERQLKIGQSRLYPILVFLVSKAGISSEDRSRDSYLFNYYFNQ